MIQKYKNLIAGGFIFLFSLVFFINTFQIKLTNIDTFVGSRLFPQIVTLILMALSLWLIVDQILKNRKGSPSNDASNEQSEDAQPKPQYVKTVLVFAALAVYILMLEHVGFLIATMLYLFSQMFLLEAEGKKIKGLKKVIQYVLISVITTVAVYYLFTEGFSLVLPRGRIF